MIFTIFVEQKEHMYLFVYALFSYIYHSVIAELQTYIIK